MQHRVRDPKRNTGGQKERQDCVCVGGGLVRFSSVLYLCLSLRTLSCAASFSISSCVSSSRGLLFLSMCVCVSLSVHTAYLCCMPSSVMQRPHSFRLNSLLLNSLSLFSLPSARTLLRTLSRLGCRAQCSGYVKQEVSERADVGF